MNSTKSIVSTSAVEGSKPTRNRLLTPEQAGKYLGIDPRTVTRWARAGYLPAHPLGEGKRKFWRFYQHELDAWLAARTNQREVVRSAMTSVFVIRSHRCARRDRGFAIRNSSMERNSAR